MKTPGYIVTTKSGKKGRTKHNDRMINGKVQVYLDEGGKLLCDFRTLTINGYID